MEIGQNSLETGPVCLECGRPLLDGRAGRKFCSVECKNRYNNRRAHLTRNIKMRVWKSLEKNHLILSGLLNLGLQQIQLTDLAALGFNDDCVTSWHKVKGWSEMRCFDITYVVKGSRICDIRRAASSVSELRQGEKEASD